MAKYINYSKKEVNKLLNKFLKLFVKEYVGFSKGYIDTILKEVKVQRASGPRSFAEGSNKDQNIILSFLVDMGKNIHGCNNDSTKCAASENCVLTKFGFTCTNCKDNEVFNPRLAICENECSSQYILKNNKCSMETKSLVAIKNFKTNIGFRERYNIKDSKEFVSFSSGFEVRFLASVEDDPSVVGIVVNNLEKNGNDTKVDFTVLLDKNKTDETVPVSNALAETLARSDVKEALSPVQTENQNEIVLQHTDYCLLGQHDCDSHSRCISLSAFEYRCESCNITCNETFHTLCGTDGKSYQSYCELFLAECVENKVIRKQYDGLCIDKVPVMAHATFESKIENRFMLPALNTQIIKVTSMFFNTDVKALREDYFFSNKTITNIENLTLQQISSVYSLNLNMTLHKALNKIQVIEQNVTLRNIILEQKLGVLRLMNASKVSRLFGNINNMTVSSFSSSYNKLTKEMYDPYLVNHFIENQVNSSRNDFNAFNLFFDTPITMKNYILATVREDMSRKPYLLQLGNEVRNIISKIIYKPQMDSLTIADVIANEANMNSKSVGTYLKLSLNMSDHEASVMSDTELNTFKYLIAPSKAPSMMTLIDEIKMIKDTMEKYTKEFPVITLAVKSDITGIENLMATSFYNILSTRTMNKDLALKISNISHAELILMKTTFAKIFQNNLKGFPKERLVHLTWNQLTKEQHSNMDSRLDGYVNSGYTHLLSEIKVKDIKNLYAINDGDANSLSFENVLVKYFGMKNDEFGKYFTKNLQDKMTTIKLNRMLEKDYLYGNIAVNNFDPAKNYNKRFELFMRIQISSLPFFCGKQEIESIQLDELIINCTKQNVQALGNQLSKFVLNDNITIHSLKKKISIKIKSDVDKLNIQELLTLAYDNNSYEFLQTFKDLLPSQSSFISIADKSILDILHESNSELTTTALKTLITYYNGYLPNTYSTPLTSFGKTVEDNWSTIYNNQVKLFFKYLNSLNDRDHIFFNDISYSTMMGLCEIDVKNTIGFIIQNCTGNNYAEYVPSTVNELTISGINQLEPENEISNLELLSIISYGDSYINKLRSQASKPFIFNNKVTLQDLESTKLNDAIKINYNISDNVIKSLLNISNDDTNKLNVTFQEIVNKSDDIQNLNVAISLPTNIIVNHALIRNNSNVALQAKIIESQQMILRKPVKDLLDYYGIEKLNDINMMNPLNFNKKYLGANDETSSFILGLSNNEEIIIKNTTFGEMTNLLPLIGNDANMEPISPLSLIEHTSSIPLELRTQLLKTITSFGNESINKNSVIANIFASNDQVDVLKKYIMRFPPNKPYLDEFRFIDSIDNVTLGEIYDGTENSMFQNDTTVAELIGIDLATFSNFKGFQSVPFGDWYESTSNYTNFKDIFTSMGYPNALSSKKYFTVPAKYKSFIESISPQSGMQKLSINADESQNKTIASLIHTFVEKIDNISKRVDDDELIKSLDSPAVILSDAFSWNTSSFIEKTYGIKPIVLFNDLKYLEKPIRNTTKIINELNKLILKDLKDYTYNGSKPLNETTETGQLLFKAGDFLRHHFENEAFDKVMENRLTSAKKFRKYNLGNLIKTFDLKNNEIEEKSPLYISSTLLGMKKLEIMEDANLTENQFKILSNLKIKDFKKFGTSNDDFYNIPLNDFEKKAENPQVKFIASDINDLEKTIGNETYKNVHLIEALALQHNISKKKVDSLLDDFISSNDEGYYKSFNKAFLKSHLQKFSIDELRKLNKLKTMNDPIETVRDLVMGLTKKLHTCEVNTGTCERGLTCLVTSLGRTCGTCSNDELVNGDNSKCEYKCGPTSFKKIDKCKSKEMKMVYANGYNTDVKFDRDLLNKSSPTFKEYSSSFEVLMQDALHSDNITKGIFVHNLRPYNDTNTTSISSTNATQEKTIVDFYAMLEIPNDESFKTPTEMLKTSLDDALVNGRIPFAEPTVQAFTLKEHSLCESGTVKCGAHANCVQLSSFDYRCECESGYELNNEECKPVGDKDLPLYLGLTAVIIALIALGIMAGRFFIKWKRTKTFIPFTTMNTEAEGF